VGTSASQLGVVAAGHELSARAGADALRAGGNAVDAAVAAMLTALSCEPLLTGLGAGGYMLIAGTEAPEPVLLDFFVEAPGRGLAPGAARAELVPVTVNFGDAEQVFHIGVASVGTYGVPAGIAAASSRFGRLPLRELTAPAAATARAGVTITPSQAYMFEILADLVSSTPESRALFAPQGSLPSTGDTLRQPELADALEALGEEGAEPFYAGEIAARVLDWLGARGGLVTAADLRAYEVIDRVPIRTAFRGRTVLTNPPPSAGGILIARALQQLDAAGPGPATVPELVAAIDHTQRVRTPEFLEGLSDTRFVEEFLRGTHGSTTHVAVLDAQGTACSVTSSNGSSSGVVVPGTGLHLNNMLGEQDLNPLGFHRHPPGRRLPSMMAPTAVLRDGVPELVLGSAGSNRIRSAILQTIVRVIDDGLPVEDAVKAPRLHLENSLIYTEPGIELDPGAYAHAPFQARNLFFGGVQAVTRDHAGRLAGAGDPRRGGAAIVVAAS
jgi:gamma-glutamyltranspeptidase / glutathione hydrolase